MEELCAQSQGSLLILFRKNYCILLDQYVASSVANLETLKKGFSEMKQAVEKVMVRFAFLKKWRV